ncbi:3-hydroxyacyl-ACP dehydratase [Psychromonas sp.]|uniref:ApeI family dehydratase n=1 Tax=Psychromonas sp. TaxID=1884585 RepID=UPI00356918EB
MTLRKATICQQSVTENEVRLSLLIDPELTDFKGHFTGFPILPGVTQLDWAIFYGQQFLNCPERFKGMEVIKFQEAILPNNRVELTLTWDAEKGKLTFSYISYCDAVVIKHSSGRIKLGAI